MSPLLAAVLLVAIVALATVVGVLLRRGDGRSRTVPADALRPEDLALPPGAFGERATIVQFGTELCAKCPATRRLLTDIAREREGVRHVDVDLTHRPDIAQRFRVLQTPTTLLLDEHGVLRARIAGAPVRATVVEELDSVERTTHV